ncbi:hypothetical protein Golax_019311 [Gossypium laxum]|uniref:Uncharacterized protein n=1 Tax=Gossypium laxum TaxID=34288 RepID=A0A7J8Z5W3_9ROSI|nr:hypothetical protein [Gossypium laxum]
MGKTSSDKHLALFMFVVYGLIVFPKALGYVSVELADFLFHIEKWYIDIPRNIMEGSMDDPEHSTYWVRWSFVGSLNWHMGNRQLFLVEGSEPIREPFSTIPSENIYLVVPKKKQNLCVSTIQWKEEEQQQAYVKEKEEEIMGQQQRQLDMKGREEELRIQLERR